MWKYAIRRVLEMVPVLLGVSFFVFMLSNIIPGDPVEYFLLPDDTIEDYLRVYHALGLDKPIIDRYWDFITKAVVGDFGISFVSDQPVAPMILSRLPNTLRLALLSVAISTAISIPLGVYAATHHNKKSDYATMLVALFGVSMPNFWFAILLILIFAVTLGWFPAGGMNSTGIVGEWDIEHLILPAFTLGFTMAAATARLTRSALLEVLGQDYIRTARAKGTTRRKVIWKHALRNALIPVVTVIGLQFAHELGGAMIIEVVFAYPGVGMLLYDSIMGLDYFMLQGCILVVATFFVFCNLIVDLLYAYIDPRISYE